MKALVMDSAMASTNAHVPRLLLEHFVQVRIRIFETSYKIIQLCFIKGINFLTEHDHAQARLYQRNLFFFLRERGIETTFKID